MDSKKTKQLPTHSVRERLLYLIQLFWKNKSRLKSISWIILTLYFIILLPFIVVEITLEVVMTFFISIAFFIIGLKHCSLWVAISIFTNFGGFVNVSTDIVLLFQVSCIIID